MIVDQIVLGAFIASIILAICWIICEELQWIEDKKKWNDNHTSFGPIEIEITSKKTDD